MLLLGVLALLTATSCAGQQGGERSSTPSEPTPVSVVYTVTGMSCGGCAKNLEDTLKKVEGVISANASFEQSEATVVCKSAAQESKVLAAMEGLGFVAVRKAP